MLPERSLFTAMSEAPTIPLSSARIIVAYNNCILCFHSSEGRIMLSMSKDDGSTWGPATEVAIDCNGQFTAVSTTQGISLIYVTSSKGLKMIDIQQGLVPDVPPSGQVLYMHHEETGEPSYPSACVGLDGSIYICCSFKRPGRWSVLYTRVNNGDRGLWDQVDTGDGPTPGHAAITVAADGEVHVVYRVLMDGKYHLFHRVLSGTEWSPISQLTFSMAQNGTPSLMADGPLVHAAWARTEPGRSAIVYRRYANGSWGGEVRLSEAAGLELNYPTLSASYGVAAVAWEEGELVKVRASFNCGDTWTEQVYDVEGAGRYPKMGPISILPDGSMKFCMVWTRITTLPWSGSTGVDIVSATIRCGQEKMELIYGSGGGERSKEIPPVADNSPRIRFVDVRGSASYEEKSLGTTKASDALVNSLPKVPALRSEGAWKAETDDRLAQSEKMLEEIDKRVASVERRYMALRDEHELMIRELRGQVSVLSKRIEAMSAKQSQQTTRPNEPHIAPLSTLKVGGEPVDPRRVSRITEPSAREAGVPSGARFKEPTRKTPGESSVKAQGKDGLMSRILGKGRR